MAFGKLSGFFRPRTERNQTQQKPVESGSKLEAEPDAEGKVRTVIADLDAYYGAEKTNIALGRIFGTVEFTLSMPEVSDRLMKYLEPINKECGDVKVIEALKKIWQERGVSAE